MSETIYDGPPSVADLERSLVEVAVERDQLRQQVEKLLSKIDVHRLERSATSTPQRFSRDSALYQAADQVRKELEGR